MIPEWRNGLDHEQAAAAAAPGSLVVVQAGAGSGKTRTLIARALRALDEGARHIILLAFTRSAAREIQRRIGEGDRRVVATTIHGLAAALLHRWEGPALPRGISAQFQVAGDDVLKIIGEKKENATARTARRQSDLLSYAEILQFAVEALREGAVPPAPDLVLVDEAQDLTPLQWEFVRRLGARERFVVGDIAQGIFGWNGADVGEFCKEMAAADQQLAIHTNYRAVPDLVALANRIPTPGRLTLSAAILPDPGAARPPVAVGLDQDVGRVVETAAGVLGQNSGLSGWKRVAVLTRTRDRLREVAEALDQMGIPYVAPVLAGDLWETPEALVVLSAVHVAANRHSSLHLHHLLTAAGWSPAALARLEADRAGRMCSLFDMLRDAASLPEILYQSSAEWKTLEVRLAVREVLQMFCGWGYEDRFRSTEGTSVWAVLAAVDHWSKWAPAGADLASDFLAWFADPQREEPVIPGDRVYLTTIHGAKGLEWPHVILYGLEEGCLPHARSLRGDGTALEEERRLFYVACTRARKALTLMYYSTHRRHRNADPESAQPSRFLREVGM